MTELAEVVDGLAADTLVVVLMSGQPALVEMSRAAAIEQGLTVVDADPDMLRRIIATSANDRVRAESRWPGDAPLDVSAGVPLRDLRARAIPAIGDRELAEQAQAEVTVPIRQEPTAPVLSAPPVGLAHPPVEIGPGNRVADDAPPAQRHRGSWDDDLRVNPAPLVETPGWSPTPDVTTPSLAAGEPATGSAQPGPPATPRPSDVVLQALDADEDLSVPQWVVLDRHDAEPAISPSTPAQASTATDHDSARPAVDPSVATPVAVTQWQDPVWSTSVKAEEQSVPSAGSPVAPAFQELPVEQPTVWSVDQPPVTTAEQVAEPTLRVVPPPVADPSPSVFGSVVPTQPGSTEPAPTQVDGGVSSTDVGLSSADPGLSTAAPARAEDPVDTAVPAISATGLTRTYVGPLGPVPVLRGVEVDLAPGDLLVIRAESGAGTTTLLSCLAGLDLPDDGHVYVNGESMATWSDADRARYRAASAGFIPQTQELVDDLNTRDNVSLPLLAAGWGSKAARQEAMRLLDAFGLDDRAFFFPSQLSHSDRVHAAVARALAGDPFVVWADDPTAGLDEIRSQLIVDALLTHHRRGATVVVVSRDQRFVLPTARVARLDGGLLSMVEADSLRWAP